MKMKAKFTKEALINYASMIEKYGDIYVNEYGQISLNKDSHEAKYQDERRKVPARSCMYAHLHKNNFPSTAKELDEMFLKQTLERNANAVMEADAKKAKKVPEVVKADKGAFDRLIKAKTEAEKAEAKAKAEVGKKELEEKARIEAELKAKTEAEEIPTSHPDVIMPLDKK